MAADSESLFAEGASEALRKIRERTPARIFVGRAGASYLTATQLDLRDAHASAKDAVRTELDLESVFGSAFIREWDLFEVSTEARTKEEYLLHPDLGRRLNEISRRDLARLCSRGNDIQIALGDGLSVTAIAAQVPSLLPLIHKGAQARGCTVGRPFVIRHCRVGVLNDIGELLAPKVAVLLIGERPGLATSESLSAYMAYRPNGSHTDANRNLISNIHSQGLTPRAAAERVLNLAAQIMAARASGVSIREKLPGAQVVPGLSK